MLKATQEATDTRRYHGKSSLPKHVTDQLNDAEQNTYLDAVNAAAPELSETDAHHTAMAAVIKKHRVSAPEGKQPKGEAAKENTAQGCQCPCTECQAGNCAECSCNGCSECSMDSSECGCTESEAANESQGKESGYLVSGKDGDHLPTRRNGKLDPHLLAAAHAALFSNFRGKSYEGPDKEEAKAKLKSLYKEAGMDWPEEAKESFEAVEALAEAVAVSAPKAEGWVWETEMLKPGLSLNGTMYYTPEFIRQAAKDFDGCPSYADHQPTPSGSVRNVVGSFKNVSGASGVMKGELHLLESEDWMRQKLLAAQKANMPLGLSINAIIGLKKNVREGKEVMEPVRIIPNTPRSVDVVMFPAAGGRVVRAVAGTDFEAALKNAREQFCGEREVRVSAITTPRAAQTKERLSEENVRTLEQRIDASEKKQRTTESRLLLAEKLAESKLPMPMQILVRKHFEGKEVTLDALSAEIAAVRETYAAMVPSNIRATGGRAQVVMESGDRMQIALDKFFGLRSNPFNKEEKYDDIPAFRGIQEAYIALTGDKDLQWTPPAGRITEEWDSAGFSNALGNTLYRRMTQDYREADFGLDLLCPPREPHRTALKDFRTHEIIRVGYLGDLPQNDPEQQDWEEIDAPTDEKATLAAVQFGGLVTVTRKTIINDDLGLVAKIASRLGRAARRTMAQRLFNLMANNAAIYDGVNFFHGTHNNLGSTALSATQFAAIRTAMRKQTEKDSGKMLGLVPRILVVPPDLESVAITENERQFINNNFDPNPGRYMFGRVDQPTVGDSSTTAIEGANGEKPRAIIVSTLLADMNDWYAFADPDDVQTFEIGFLQGKAEPELLLADNQLVGKAFTSDRIQYKVRHEYEVTVVDYRGAYKEVVA